MTEEERLDRWLAIMRVRSRAELVKAGLSPAEIVPRMADYEQELAAWRCQRLIAVQRERQEIAEGEFHLHALEAWEPGETGSRMH